MVSAGDCEAFRRGRGAAEGNAVQGDQHDVPRARDQGGSQGSAAAAAFVVAVAAAVGLSEIAAN